MRRGSVCSHMSVPGARFQSKSGKISWQRQGSPMRNAPRSLEPSVTPEPRGRLREGLLRAPHAVDREGPPRVLMSLGKSQSAAGAPRRESYQSLQLMQRSINMRTHHRGCMAFPTMLHHPSFPQISQLFYHQVFLTHRRSQPSRL